MSQLGSDSPKARLIVFITFIYKQNLTTVPSQWLIGKKSINRNENRLTTITTSTLANARYLHDDDDDDDDDNDDEYYFYY